MKLVLLHHQFQGKGGLEGYLREFAGRLQSAGHELTFVTTCIDPEYRALAHRVVLIPPAWNRRATMARFAAGSAQLVPALRADAILGFGRTWKQDIHRAGGGCHARYSSLLPWWKRWRSKNQLELQLERRLYTGRETRCFVVNSPMVQQELQEWYQVEASRISVVPTAVDSSHWQPAASPEERNALRSQLGLPQSAPILLFASLDHRRKGLGPLLQALTRVPEAHLYVAGQSLNRWQTAIRQHGLRDRVTGIGRTDLLPWYQAADWFVHPTRYDACANTVLQSMACGLPGLVSTSDGAAAYIQNGKNGFLLPEPTNPEALAQTLQSALALSQTERDPLSSAARTTMLPLTWDYHLTQWFALLQKAAP